MSTTRWAWPARIGWGLVLLNVAHGILGALVLTVAGSGALSGDLKDSPEGMTWEELAAEEPWLARFLDPFLRLLGVAWLAMGVLGLAVAWRPFRDEARWAWAVLWVYPLHQLFQASDFLFREGAMFGLFFHVALAALGIAGLALTASRFFGAGTPRGPPRAALE